MEEGPQNPWNVPIPVVIRYVQSINKIICDLIEVQNIIVILDRSVIFPPKGSTRAEMIHIQQRLLVDLLVSEDRAIKCLKKLGINCRYALEVPRSNLTG